jgi:hypothetical protein
MESCQPIKRLKKKKKKKKEEEEEEEKKKAKESGRPLTYIPCIY